ncbi:McrB family protein [Bacillus cereus]
MNRIDEILNRYTGITYEKIVQDFQYIFEKKKKSKQDWFADYEIKVANTNWGKDKKESIISVIQKIKTLDYEFIKEDIHVIEKFTASIDEITKLNNFINIFKNTKCDLVALFNTIKKCDSYDALEVNVDKNLQKHLPHLYSVIKFIQYPDRFPIYYKFWSKINKVILKKGDDYLSLVKTYRSFCGYVGNRFLEFGSYFGTISQLIVDDINELSPKINLDEYRYLNKTVLNLTEDLEQLKVKLACIGSSKSVSTYFETIQSKIERDGKCAVPWSHRIIDSHNYFVENKPFKFFIYENGKKPIRYYYSVENFVTTQEDGQVCPAEWEQYLRSADEKGTKKTNGYTRKTWMLITKAVELSTPVPYSKLVPHKNSSLNAGKFRNAIACILDPVNNNIAAIIDKQNDEKKLKVGEKMYPNPNIILYGPPGTGKTYNSINYALSIIEHKQLKELDKESRSDLLKRFNSLREEGRIDFITFHQNYSYEDFIQGIKPDTASDIGLAFYRHDGILKKMVDKILKPTQIQSGKRLGDSNYVISKVTNELIYINNNHGNLISIPVNIVNELMEGLKNKWITLDDIKNKQNSSGIYVHELIKSKHDKLIISGYPNVLRLLCEEMQKVQSLDAEDRNYVLIIDEINRGNIARIFGELITLIEKDKRLGNKNPMFATLPSGEHFTIPKNLFIIGTMNTADKSIALLDIALRRRFDFIMMYPDYSLIENYAGLLKKINDRIYKEKKSTDFLIGHSFFIGKTKDDAEHIFNREIIPLLNEYFYNKPELVESILNQANITCEMDENYQLMFKEIKEE